MVSSIFSSYSLSFFLSFPKAYFSFYFLFSLRYSLFCFHSSSVLVFLIKYLVPLNYLVKVADTKNILLLSLDKRDSSASFKGSSFIFIYFSVFLCFSPFYLLAIGFYSSMPVKVNMSAGISNIWSVGKELRFRLNFTFLPFSRI